MQWELRRKGTQKDFLKTKKAFESREQAEAHLSAIGTSFRDLYEAVPHTDDPVVFRMLTEGLVAGDLRRIILPQVSIDEYVPGDPDTDNVVIAFFIKGVPEAVIPFRDFVMKCSGVLDVAYGESDTIPNTSIVYAEMSRNKFKFDDLYTIMEQIGMLSDLEVSDFSVVFPNSSKRYPYSPEVIQAYFENRSAAANQQAQDAAIDKADQDQESTGGDGGDNEKITKDEVEEALVEFLVESFGKN